MIRTWQARNVSITSMILATIALLAGVTAKAQSVQGVINGRSGATMTLQTPDAPKLIVLLTPTTQVDEVEGIFKGRKKEMALTSLIPGLPVQVTGSTNAQGQLVADTVKFKGTDLKAAMDAQAGLQPTVEAQQEHEAQIQQSEQELAAQKAALAAQQAQLVRKIRRSPRTRRDCRR